MLRWKNGGFCCGRTLSLSNTFTGNFTKVSHHCGFPLFSLVWWGAWCAKKEEERNKEIEQNNLIKQERSKNQENKINQLKRALATRQDRQWRCTTLHYVALRWTRTRYHVIVVSHGIRRSCLFVHFTQFCLFAGTNVLPCLPQQFAKYKKRTREEVQWSTTKNRT